MTSNHEQFQHAALSCSELKASLSAYLDDELTRDERLRSDAHLVDCNGCRDLIERAEALDETLRAKFAADSSDALLELSHASANTTDDSANEQTISFASHAMQARVFAAIGADERRTWTPRIAAAACIALVALGAYFVWTRIDRGELLAPAKAGEFARGNDNTLDMLIDPVAPPANASTMLASLDADDRQALYATSILLDMAQRTSFADASRRAELRETARYDELVQRLGGVLSKLPAQDRATVALARDAAARIVSLEEDPQEWARLQEDVSTGELDVSIDQLSNR